VETIIQERDGVTPTPVISRPSWFTTVLAETPGDASLLHRRTIRPRRSFKYNPTNGGPADTDVTRWVEGRANELLRAGNAEVTRVPFAKAMQAASTHQETSSCRTVRDLQNVVDIDAIRGAGLKLGVDPFGGSAQPYWEPINSILRHGHRRRKSND